MNTLESYAITTPTDKPGVCARMEIVDLSSKFVFRWLLTVGQTYTISLWMRSEAEGRVQIGSVKFSSAAEWKKQSLTFTAESERLVMHFLVPGAYYIYQAKLETGNKVTDWTPAPEDMATGKDLDAVNEEILAVYKSVSTVDVKADSILASVEQVKKSTDEAISTLEQSVSAKMSSEDVKIEIGKAVEQVTENGVSRVTTTTGFTMNEDGLLVEKTGREMSTRISENGMTVFQNGSEVLVANNQGVNAKNLHATTYLIVGGRSRFENFGSGRTGCFWIGGS